VTSVQPQLRPSSDSLKFVGDALQKTYWESLHLLVRNAGFYFAITAALVGYVVTRNLSAPLTILVLWMSLATSVLTLVVGWIATRSIFEVVRLIEVVMRQSSEGVLSTEDMDHLFVRWRTVLWAFAIGGTTLIILICIGIVTLLA
jgi:hypothetical protein